MYEQRIKTVRRNLANRGLEQMLVCDPRSIHYLTGAFIEPGERFRRAGSSDRTLDPPSC